MWRQQRELENQVLVGTPTRRQRKRERGQKCSGLAPFHVHPLGEWSAKRQNGKSKIWNLMGIKPSGVNTRIHVWLFVIIYFVNFCDTYIRVFFSKIIHPFQTHKIFLQILVVSTLPVIHKYSVNRKFQFSRKNLLSQISLVYLVENWMDLVAVACSLGLYSSMARVQLKRSQVMSGVSLLGCLSW